MADNSTGIVQAIGQGGIGNLQGVATAVLPKILAGGSIFVNVVAWILIFIVLAVVMGVVFFIVIQRRRYKNTLIIFERINNVWVDTFLDKGMEVKFSPLGTSVMYFKSLKRYEPMPKIQSGNRKFYFKKYADGTLINFRLDDNENETKEQFIDMNKAMLYHHTGINRGLQNRYDKQPLWKEYLPLILSSVYIVIMGVMIWFALDKMLQTQTAINAGITTSNLVLDKANAILGSLSNVCNGGTGYIKAG